MLDLKILPQAMKTYETICHKTKIKRTNCIFQCVSFNADANFMDLTKFVAKFLPGNNRS